MKNNLWFEMIKYKMVCGIAGGEGCISDQENSPITYIEFPPSHPSPYFKHVFSKE